MSRAAAAIAPVNYIPMPREVFESRWPLFTRQQVSFHLHQLLCELRKPHFLDTLTVTSAEREVMENLCRFTTVDERVGVFEKRYLVLQCPNPPKGNRLRHKHEDHMAIDDKARKQGPSPRYNDPRTTWVPPTREQVEAIHKSQDAPHRLAIDYTVHTEGDSISFRPTVIRDGPEYLRRNRWHSINSVNFMCAYLTSGAFWGSHGLRPFEYSTIALLELMAALSARHSADIILRDEFIAKWGTYDVGAALQLICDEWAADSLGHRYTHWSPGPRSVDYLRGLRGYTSGANRQWQHPPLTFPHQTEMCFLRGRSRVEEWGCIPPNGQGPRHFRCTTLPTGCTEATPLLPVSYGCCIAPVNSCGRTTTILYTPREHRADAQPEEYNDLINAVNVVYDFFRLREVVDKRGFLRNGERSTLLRAKHAAYHALFPDRAEFVE